MQVVAAVVQTILIHKDLVAVVVQEMEITGILCQEVMHYRTQVQVVVLVEIIVPMDLQAVADLVS
jgi:hypothetical protein